MNGAPNAKESPLFVKLFDFAAWVIPLTTKFPRAQRFVLAQHLQQAVLGAYETAVRAGMSKEPQAISDCLDDVATQLTLTRHYLRLAFKLSYITIQQLEYATDRLAEIGRLVRAWQGNVNPDRSHGEARRRPQPVTHVSSTP